MKLERRNSYRCQVQSHEPVGILKNGGVSLAVRVLNESRDGFGVISDRKTQVETGQLLSLTTPAGCWEVRVKHSRQHNGATRIGLQRVRELDTYTGSRGLRSLLFPRPRTSVKVSTFALFAVLGVGFGVMFWVGFGPRLGWRSPVSLVESSPSFLRPTASPTSWRIAEDPSRREKQLAENFLRMEKLGSAAFIKTLNLSLGQQKQVDNVVEETTADLSTLYAARDDYAPGVWSHMAAQLVRRSWGDVQGVLTEDQKRRWDALLEEPPERRQAAAAAAVQHPAR